MSDIACNRIWQVEAVRDGRISGADRASFERHLPTCAECRSEVSRLDALAEVLRALPTPKVDDLAARRRRQEILAAADRQTLREVAPRRKLAPWLVAVAAMVAAGSLIVIRAHRRRPTTPPTTEARSTATAAPVEASIEASSGARWSRRHDGGVQRIDLVEGELSIDVRHVMGAEHVVVSLPDGELEDIGTRFVVAAHGAHTSHVIVREGLVVLRLHGRPEVRIGAGSSWVAPANDAAPVPATSACVTIVGTNAPPAKPPQPPALVAVGPAATPAAASSAAVDLVTSELQAAMSELRAGNHASAAARFGAFVAAHPADARTEDAAYLRVIALRRAGDSTAMQQAAKDYLARFPKGFRRREVEALAP